MLRSCSLSVVIFSILTMDSPACGMHGSGSLFSHTLRSLIIMLLVSTSYCISNQNDGNAAKSVFSLFNLREKSRFWSEDVLRNDLDDLDMRSTGLASLENFTKAGVVAQYLKLSEVDSIYLPLPVNFIFIGFNGKGNHDFILNAEELERWFMKIDHTFEHTHLFNVEKAFPLFNKMDVENSPYHHNPQTSHIYYNFSIHGIKMGENVASIFERTLNILARKDDVSDNGVDGNTLWQVNVDTISIFFNSLVEYLQLENVYNIFVLNPKRGGRARYGYRKGLSESEIHFISNNKSLQAELLQQKNSVDINIDLRKRPLYETQPMSAFSLTIAEELDTVEWSEACGSVLDDLQKWYDGKNHMDVVMSEVRQMLKGNNMDPMFMLEKGLKFGNLSGLHSDCLTDTWIGENRWMFMDLSAGPFSWGPTVGGDGVRTELSLPNIENTVGTVLEISEDEAEDRLHEVIQEKFSVFGDDHHAIDVLLAEIDIYELFTFKHCRGRKTKLSLCEELDERMKNLKNDLKSFDDDSYDDAHREKAVEMLKRMENWNIFSDTYEEHGNYTVARDTFLSHLGAALLGSMRHVITPSVADGEFHYYEKISFQLFFITQEKVAHIKQLPVGLKTIMDGLSTLILPSQKVLFSPHMLSLSEDPALEMAFSISKRAAAFPILLVDGTFRKTIRSYLDSSILQSQLQRLEDHKSMKGMRAHDRSVLEVPIFWFVNGDPLLLDKHYQAKPLSDMVIVVQSDYPSWESHLQCNGQSLLWDLRRPMKAALAAVAEHMAGLLPLHLVYSHAYETAIEDWTWSVGCSPHSATSQGWHISQFQKDSMARSYITTSIDESVKHVNSAIYMLIAEKTTEHAFNLLKSRERELGNKYNYVVGLWRRTLVSTSKLHFTESLRLLNILQDASQGFLEYVNTTVEMLHPIHCTRETRVDVDVDTTTIPAFLLLFALLLLLLRPRRPKPKLN